MMMQLDPTSHGSTEVTLPDDGVNLDAVLEEIENDLILQALQRTGGNKTEAAKLLKLNRTTFIERLRKKGLLQLTGATRSRSETAKKNHKPKCFCNA